MHLGTLSLALLTIGVAAVPTPGSYVSHERRHAAPSQWVKRSRVQADVLLPVRVGLTQSNLNDGPRLLDEVSNPLSPKYGAHYTAEEIHDLFAPAPASVIEVSAWLHGAGIHPDRISQSTNKQWLQFDATSGEVEGLLHAEYHHFEHISSGKSTIGTDEYHVPSYLRPHIDYITPGLKLLTSRPAQERRLDKRTFGVTDGKPVLPSLKALPDSLANILKKLPDLSAICSTAIIPQCISTLYNITKATKKAPGNQLGIFEDLNDKYAQTDLDEFFATLAPNIPIGTHPTLDSIDGATAPANVANAGPESDLDFQVSYPIIYPQNSILFQTDDDVYEANYVYQGFLNNFLDAIDGSYCTFSAYGETGNSQLDPPYPDPQAGGYKGKLQCGVYKPTNVISISYGGQEADLPPSYQQRQCSEFMKLGMQGVSIVLASGDSGVAGPAGDDNADGCLGTGQIFSPDFPATCPWLTVVGATTLPAGADAKKDQETAVTRFGSGGGFSNIYKIPTYQQTTVANYFKNTPPPYPYYTSTTPGQTGNGTYNRAGRGYPDVAAVGDNIVIFNMGAPTLIGGTSASAPIFASILNRINEERIAVGKRTVGFVNPSLYQWSDAFHDITTGNNPGCNTNGFSCVKGWDPVTGLGTPNYPVLLAKFLALP